MDQGNVVPQRNCLRPALLGGLDAVFRCVLLTMRMELQVGRRAVGRARGGTEWLAKWHFSFYARGGTEGLAKWHFGLYSKHHSIIV